MPDAPPVPADLPSAPAEVTFDPAEAIRQARAFLTRQRDIAGPLRFLSPLASPEASGAALIAEPADEPAADVASGAADASAPVSLQADERPSPEAPDSSDPSDSDDSVPDLFGELPDPSQDPTLSPYERVASLVPEDSPLREMDSLEEIRDWLSKTVLVPIDEGRINPVLGVGPADADLMVIGEAPGADEDRTGEPFVGRAGQLLDKILDAVLFDRDEVYITNILKSRPPNNRDPLTDEEDAHIPILYKQIALVQPKVILAVGKSAGNGLLSKSSSLASLRGKFHDYYGIPLMVTYHPAALLRNPQWKRPTWEDVKLLRTRYDELDGVSRRRDA